MRPPRVAWKHLDAFAGPASRIVVCIALLSGSCRNGRESVELELRGRAMGTTWRLLLVDDPGSVDLAVLRAELVGILEGLESEMSHWREDSVVSRFNRAPPGVPIEISPALAELILEARGLHELTEGALEITILPLVELWGFGPSGPRHRPPGEGEIAGSLQRVGLRHLSMDRLPGGAFALGKTTAGVQIDLSAIGKGFAIDRLARYLDRRGHGSYLIELGGELRARGVNASGRVWRVGLEEPDPDSVGRVRCRVRLENMAIATSGDYRLFFRDPAGESQSYSHLIDPRTGRPVDHGLASVSVIAASAARADGLATALLVLGPDRGHDLAERIGLAAAFVARTATGFEERVTAAFRAARIEVER